MGWGSSFGNKHSARSTVAFLSACLSEGPEVNCFSRLGQVLTTVRLTRLLWGRFCDEFIQLMGYYFVYIGALDGITTIMSGTLLLINKPNPAPPPSSQLHCVQPTLAFAPTIIVTPIPNLRMTSNILSTPLLLCCHPWGIFRLSLHVLHSRGSATFWTTKLTLTHNLASHNWRTDSYPSRISREPSEPEVAIITSCLWVIIIIRFIEPKPEVVWCLLPELSQIN